MISNWEKGMDKGAEYSLAYRVLSHLNKHPKQCDTIRGIAEWWLLEQRIHTEISRVKKALAALVQKELVLKEAKNNSLILYRVNPSKSREIEAFLRQGNHLVPMD